MIMAGSLHSRRGGRLSMGRARIAALLCAVLATIALYKAAVVSEKNAAARNDAASVASARVDRRP
jgi:hypothetical protein